MNIQVVTGIEEIKALLPRLKAATEPGRTADGVRLMVRYKGFNVPTAQAIQEAAAAREEGLDLRTYTGVLDRVFRNARAELCFTVLCLERVDEQGRHRYRTFNCVRGHVSQIVVLGENRGHGQTHKP